MGSLTLVHEASTAHAQGKGNGNGNGKGGGNGGGNGNGKGGGKGGGNSGKSNSNANGNGNGQANGRSTGAAPSEDAPDSPNSPTVDVHHQDGIQEAIKNGRYIMRDRQGRVIIDRKATIKDRFRLRRFTD